ncbi:MAG: hypothetical protein QM703_22385 [Gemmatales bacterium]
MMLVLLFAFMQQPALPTTPEAALSAYRQAIDKGDPEAFANLTAGVPGNTLRSMAPALKKAQAASDAFTKALGEKPALNVTNPFANELNPLQGYQFELIELTKGKDEHLARVRFGLANRLQEETLSVKKEGDGYRVSAPSVYLKSIKELTPERLKKQVDSLNALAGILNNLAEQVSKGQLTTKEAILIKLAQAVKDIK